MKRKIGAIIVVCLIMLGVLGLAVYGSGAAISQTSAGSTTDLSHPATYLADGKADTYWCLRADATQGWAQLTLAKPALIYGLKLTGSLGANTQLTVEYQSGGAWLPFTAATVTTLPADGRIDLSWDRVVTQTLRIRLSGSSSASGYLSEVEVLGELAGSIIHRLQPEETTTGTGTGTSPNAPVCFLSDGNTYTGWQLHDSTTQGTAVFAFPTESTLKNINLYFNSAFSGNIQFEAFINNNWEKITNVSNQPAGWYRLDLSSNVISTAKVRLTLSGCSGTDTALSEVEFWGCGSFSGDTRQTIGAQEAVVIAPSTNTTNTAITDGGIKVLYRSVNTSAITNSLQHDLKLYNTGSTELNLADVKLRYWYTNETVKQQVAYINSASIGAQNVITQFVTVADRANADTYLGIGFSAAAGTLAPGGYVEIKLGLNAGDRTCYNQPNDFSFIANTTYTENNKYTGYLNNTRAWGKEPDSAIDTAVNLQFTRPNSAVLGNQAADGRLKVLSQSGDTAMITNSLQTNLKFENTSGAPLDLSKVKLRYWYTNDTQKQQVANIYWASCGTANVKAGFGTVASAGVTADTYLELGFTGGTLEPGAAVAVKLGLNTDDRANYKQTNDYSFNGVSSAYGENSQVTGYIDNKLAWGIEPDTRPVFDNTSYRLELAFTGRLTEEAIVEVNNTQLELQPALTLNDRTIYGGQLTAAQLWEGVNYLRIKPFTTAATLENAFLTRHDPDGQCPVALEGLSDGLLLTAAAPAATEWQFNRPILIEEATVTTTDNSAVRIYAFVNGNWTELTNWQNLDSGTRFSGPVTTNKLKLEAAGSVGELIIKGSMITDQAPAVKIFWPHSGDAISLQGWANQEIIGLVDNPQTTVNVNGADVALEGHCFTLPLSKVTAANGETVTITATAKDSTNRTGSASVAVTAGEYSEVTLDQADILFYTAASNFTISGTMNNQSAQYQVNVAGTSAPINGNRFVTSVSLKEGLNFIEVQAIKNGQLVKTFYRRVVRSSAALALTIRNPENGAYLNTQTVKVTGDVKGLAPLQVTVNGVAAAVAANTYTAIVTLTEGTNKITVMGRDAAGKTITKTITVNRDTTAPTITGVTPTEGTIFATAAVTATANVTDANTFWVTINGQVVTGNTGIYKNTLSLADGPQKITIIAQDAAGNASTAVVNVTVDTTAPVNFTPVANVTGWTNNSKPTITFNTTDATSGIDHYEISVDDGASLGVVTSPYQFTTSLAEGKQTIQVKAYDRAGNVTVGMIPVYIDTVAPGPVYYILVPGNGYIQLKWGAIPNSDITKYEIIRQPAFPNGTITKSVDELTYATDNSGNKVYVYKDSTVQNGTSYIYQVFAIDHAGNRSSMVSSVPPVDGKTAWTGPTQDSSVTAGVIQQVIPQGTEAVVQFSTGGIKIPADFGYESRVTIYEKSEADYSGISQTISPIVEFKLEVNENGTWVQKSQLPKDVILAMPYSTDNLPSGFNEDLLGMEFYAPEANGWIFGYNNVVDKVNHIVYLETNHLSPHIVSINPQTDEDIDNINFKTEDYSQGHKSIQVSESSGNLGAVFNDFSLPTPSSLGFGVARIYNTHTAESDQINESVTNDCGRFVILKGDSQTSGKSYTRRLLLNDECFASFGNGWRMNLPYISSSSYFYDFDGKAQLIDYIWDQSVGWKREYHGVNEFTVEITENSNSIKHAVIAMKNGMKLTFEKVDKSFVYDYQDGLKSMHNMTQGRVVKIEDPKSNYSQEISYIENSQSELLVKLDKIKDSLNRELKFTYGPKGITGVTLAIPGKQPQNILSYTYDEASNELKTATNILTKESDSYDYINVKLKRGKSVDGGGFAIFCSVGNSDTEGDGVSGKIQGFYFGSIDISSAQDYNVWVLKQITDELQRKDVFEYDVQHFYRQRKKHSWGFIAYSCQKYKSYYDMCLVNKTYRAFNGEKRNMIDYNYEYEKVDIGDTSDFRVRLINSTVMSGLASTKYSFVEKNEQNCLYQKAVYLNYDLVEKDTFGYGDYGKNNEGTIWRINYRKHEVNRKAVIENYDYDSWGNLCYHTSTGGDPESAADDLKEWYIYEHTDTTPSKIDITGFHNTIYTSSVPDTIHDRLLQHVALIHTPVNSTGSADTYLKEEIFRYDSTGRMDRQAVWNGEWLENKYIYSGNFSKPDQIINPLNQSINFVYDTFGNAIKTEQTVEDADGISQSVTTEKRYDSIWGWKLWEKDGRGYTTVYRYTKTDGSFDYRGRVWEAEFPDDKDPKNWTPETGTTRTNNSKTRTIYDDTNLTITMYDQLEDKIVKKFDGFGMLNSVTNYKKVGANSYKEYANTKVTYNSQGKINTITDPRGNTTTFEYNDLGNTTKIIYPGKDSPTKVIDYDFINGNVTVTDERGYKTQEIHDALGRVTCKEIKESSYNAITQSVYDGANNLVKSIDPKGSETLYIFDNLGRNTQAILPEESFVENGKDITLKPQIYYEYNAIGQKKAENRELPGGGTRRDEYQYNSLGQQIVAATIVTDSSGKKTAVKTLTYYDPNGNKVMSVDANNSGLPKDKRKVYTYTYSVLNKLLSESDPAGNTTSYTYDAIGNQTTVTDPRGNSGKYSGDFTTVYNYDDFDDTYRIVKKYSPTVPGQSEKPVTKYIYDEVGNLKEQIEPDGGKTVYTYYPRNWVENVTVIGDGKSYTTHYSYDKAGNVTSVTDSAGNTTKKEYDAVNHLSKIVYPEGNEESYDYDLNGNKTKYINGRLVATLYDYDRFNRLYQVTDALNNKTTYKYDRWGNKTRTINALDQKTNDSYDGFGRLISEEDSLKQMISYQYDLNGNKTGSQDRNGTISVYEYYPNDLLKKVTLNNGGKLQTLNYLYDEAGNRMRVSDGTVTTEFNTYNNEYVPDPYGRINQESKSYNGNNFKVAYQYDVMGRVAGIGYPTGKWVEYQYNSIGELTKVPGYVNDTPSYDTRGLISSVKAANGLTTGWDYDKNDRLTKLSYHNAINTLKEYNYHYDNANNILNKNEDSYQYDVLNQLLYANLKGSFEVKPEIGEQKIGRTIEDFGGRNPLEFTLANLDIIELDYASGSIGVDLLAPIAVSRIELNPTGATHRVTADHLLVYTSSDNSTYTKLEGWILTKQKDGSLLITLAKPATTRYIKVRCLFDERDKQLAKIDQAQFSNTAEQIVKVHYIVNTQIEQYNYDKLGNRINDTLTQRYTSTRQYTYYPNSSRLKSNEKYNFEYDANGNLIRKATVNGDTVWTYQYDLLNRLTQVAKNGQTVAKYLYDESGLRLNKTGASGTVDYVFDTDGDVLYEQENRDYLEYIYVLGKHFARVDGNLDNSTVKKYFYHTDNLGSTVTVTDEAGQTVWKSEYTPFGDKHSATGELDHAAKFTGKDLDEDTGLYYYNARWYDSELGRFVSEDPGNDPNNSNLYVYGNNNPITNIDPTGMFLEEFKNSWYGNGWRTDVEVQEYKDNIAYAEDNFSGFKYDYNSNLNLEGQVQLHLYKDALLKDLNRENKNASLPEKLGNNFEYNMTVAGLRDVLMYLQFETDLYNITHKNKRSYIYTGSQIEAASTKVAIGEALITAGLIEVINNTSVVNRSSLSRLKLQFFASNERIAGSSIRHQNGAIGEARGYAKALEKGEFGIQAPGKVTATGPDYITFNRATQTINIYDSKFSSTGKWPSSAKGFGSQSWLNETKQAINNISDPIIRQEAQKAFANGNIDWHIFTWPK